MGEGLGGPELPEEMSFVWVKLRPGEYIDPTGVV
jgi:hypothetical protein